MIGRRKLPKIFMLSLFWLILMPISINKVSSRPDWECILLWIVDIEKNGSARVKLNIQILREFGINVTVPKTAKQMEIVGSYWYSRFVEVSDGFLGVNIVELTPLKESYANLSLEYYWPDAALYFNNTFYFGANQMLRLTPSNAWSYANITILLPENGTIVKCPESYRISIRDGRETLTYEVTGQNVPDYWNQPGITEFSYFTPPMAEEIKNIQSEHIDILTHPALEPWSQKLVGYAENAYLVMNSLVDTRVAKYGRLKIYLAPRLYIEERRSNAAAFYVLEEDSIYYPSSYVFPASSGIRFLEMWTLLHEMGHAFTPFVASLGYGDPPKFVQEGVAEYLAYITLQEMGFQDDANKILARRISNPLSDPNFNVSHFFNWSAEFDSAYYAYSLYVMKGLVDSNSFVLQKMFQAWEKDRVKFNCLPNVQDRYNLFLYYFQKFSSEDATRLLRKYGMSADPSPIRTAMLVHQVLIIVDTVTVLMFSFITTRDWKLKRQFHKDTIIFLGIIWMSMIFWWTTFENAFHLFFPFNAPPLFFCGHLYSFLLFDSLILSCVLVFFVLERRKKIVEKVKSIIEFRG